MNGYDHAILVIMIALCVSANNQWFLTICAWWWHCVVFYIFRLVYECVVEGLSTSFFHIREPNLQTFYTNIYSISNITDPNLHILHTSLYIDFTSTCILITYLRAKSACFSYKHKRYWHHSVNYSHVYIKGIMFIGNKVLHTQYHRDKFYANKNNSICQAIEYNKYFSICNRQKQVICATPLKWIFCITCTMVLVMSDWPTFLSYNHLQSRIH